MNFENQSGADLDTSLAKKASLFSVIPYIGNNHYVSSAMSTVLAMKSFEENVVPMNRNLKNPCVDGLNFVMGSHEKKRVDVLVKSAVGFGSVSSATVFKRFK